MKLIGRPLSMVAVATVALTIALTAMPTAAFANTAPNPFSAAGTSWVRVPVSDRVYLQQFWRTDIDQNSVYFVPAGITCTYAFDNTSPSATATGPMLMAEDGGTYGSCVDGSNNAYVPIDDATRLGSTPFGFSINFFGQNYSSAWPNTNGGITFGAPDPMLFQKSLPNLISNSESTAMFPFGADLVYKAGVSNMWTAHTTVDGLPAVVFTWEKFRNNPPGTNIPIGEISFQLVILNVGGGDFNTYFNFDKVSGLHSENGYRGPAFLIDAKDDVAVGSNIVRTDDAPAVAASCTLGRIRTYGNATSSISTPVYFKRESATSRTISLWTNSGCTTAENIAALQDEALSKKAYFELFPDGSQDYSVAIGWGTYSSSTSAIDWTELQRNVLASTLLDNGSNPLIAQSLNTTVVGRYVIGQRNGLTVTDSATISDGVGSGPSGGSQLATTGASPVLWALAGLLALTFGVISRGFAALRKTRSAR